MQETQLVVRASVDMNFVSVDVNSSALYFFSTSRVPLLLLTKESKLHITTFDKVCASVYGIFLQSAFGLYQVCKGNWSH